MNHLNQSYRIFCSIHLHCTCSSSQQPTSVTASASYMPPYYHRTADCTLTGTTVRVRAWYSRLHIDASLHLTLVVPQCSTSYLSTLLRSTTQTHLSRLMSFDASPLLASEPVSSIWRADATEGADMDGFLQHQRSEKQWSAEQEERTVAAEHDTSEPARRARLYNSTHTQTHTHTHTTAHYHYAHILATLSIHCVSLRHYASLLTSPSLCQLSGVACSIR